MSRANQDGFSLVTAIFLLVVLAGLIGYMLNLSSVQQSTVVLSVRGAQAMQAARSGLDYAIYQALSSGCSSGTLAYTAAEPALQAYSVDLSCSTTSHLESTTPVNFYVLTATATSGNYALGGRANPDYISRRIRATISIDPP